MDISVTDFKTRCLDLIRRIEKDGTPVVIRRHGKVVARLEPAGPPDEELKPWEQLRAMGGTVFATPAESVLHEKDFEALR